MTHLRPIVYERVANLPSHLSVDAIPVMAPASGAVLCPPDFFDVIDVKNPFMAGNAGAVDRALAREQWDALTQAFASAGVTVERLQPSPGCEDMVFCANTALLGLDPDGTRACVPGRMRFESRQPEVAAMTAWCAQHGFRVIDIEDPAQCFEGSGDAIWHPGRRLLWGGYGWRTDPQVYPWLAQALSTPVIALPLTDSTFYHLDTCFLPIDERTALVHPPAIAEEGMALIRRLFERVIDVDVTDAMRFACNGAAFFGRLVVMDVRAAHTAAVLEQLGYRAILVDTGEFIKSGGSVYCMKNAFFA